MKKNAYAIMLAGSLLTATLAQAATVVHWDFDTAGMTNGAWVLGNGSRADLNSDTIIDTNDYVYSVADLSGNGNHLCPWTSIWMKYSEDTYSGSGFSMTSANDYPDSRTSNVNNPHLTGTDAQLITPLEWTVECLFKSSNLSGNRTMVGRDGRDVGGVANGAAALYFSTRGTDLAIDYRDNAGVTHIVQVDANLSVGNWYHAVATSDGQWLRLYLNGLLIGESDMTVDSPSSDYALGLGTTPGAWTVACGQWNSGAVDRFFGVIDEVAVSDVALNPAGFVVAGPLGGINFNITGSPTGNSTDTAQTLSAEIISTGESLIQAILYLDNNPVATNSTPVSGVGATNTVSGIVSVAIGVHTGKCVAVGSSISTTNEWTFSVDASVDGILYNINFAGNSGGSVSVANGIVIPAVGSAGSNLWNNFVATNVNSATPATPYTMTDAIDGSRSIGLSWYGVTHDFSSSTAGTPILLPLNQGWYGSGGADTNRTVELSGLDPNAAYDVYVYHTWRWDESAVTYTITEGTGATTSLTLVPLRATATGSYANYVEGTNYVVFANLTPSAAGQIDINAISGNGGFAALQVVAHGTGPAFDPVINSIAVAGGMVTINWTSDTLGTYQIQSKTGLASPTWTAVSGATGLSGGVGKSTSFSVSGDPSEFFRVYGE